VGTGRKFCVTLCLHVNNYKHGDCAALRDSVTDRTQYATRCRRLWTVVLTYSSCSPTYTVILLITRRYMFHVLLCARGPVACATQPANLWCIYKPLGSEANTETMQSVYLETSWLYKPNKWTSWWKKRLLAELGAKRERLQTLRKSFCVAKLNDWAGHVACLRGEKCVHSGWECTSEFCGSLFIAKTPQRLLGGGTRYSSYSFLTSALDGGE